MPTKKGITLVLILAVAAISTSAVLIRLAEAPPPVLAFYRMFFAALFFAPMALKQLRDQKISRQQLLSALVAGTFLAFHFLLWMTSLEYTSVASSVVLVTTHPLWVFLISVFFLQEKPTVWMWVGLFVALSGAVLVTFSQSDGGNARLMGDLMAVGGAIMVAVYLTIGRKLRQGLPAALYSALVFGSASLVLGLFMAVTGLPWRGYSGQTWIIFFSLAMIPTVLGHNTLNWALKYLPATMISAVILGEPLGASILAVFVLGEKPAPLEVVGSLVTLFGIFLVWWGGSGRTLNET
jgi:drug/metabolite transporter (DMT)-like permease